MAIKNKWIPGLDIAYCDQCFEVVEILRFPPLMTLEEAAMCGEVRIVKTEGEHHCDKIQADRRHDWGRRAAVATERAEPGGLDKEGMEDE